MDEIDETILLDPDIEPDTAGWAMHDWRRFAFGGSDQVNEFWTSMSSAGNGVDLATERHETYFEDTNAQEIDHVVIPESSWLFYQVPELAGAIDVTYHLRGFMQANYFAPSNAPSTLEMNPDLAMVVTQIPVDDYNVDGEQFEDNPGEPLTRIIGPDAITEPKLGIMRFDAFTFEGTGTAFTEENTPFEIELIGVPDEVIENGEILALRLWMYPDEPEHSIIEDTGNLFGSESSAAVWFPAVDTETFPDELQPVLVVTARAGVEIILPPHPRHVAKRRREQYRRPSHVLRLRGPA